MKKSSAYACISAYGQYILESTSKEVFYEKVTFFIGAVSAVAFTAVCLPLATPSVATSCNDIKFIYARGSGQALGADEYSALKSAIEADLKAVGSKLSYSFYELGSSPHGGATYPAINLNPLSLVEAFSFGKSVASGITELKNYINESIARCPSTKYVLSGYSQGAMVITETIPELNPERILYAATFGDPKLYLPEGEGLHPDACKGKNLSPYRRYAPNCRTSAGSLEAKIPYQETGWEGKIGLWCRDKDLICGAGIKIIPEDSEESIIDAAIKSHTSYISGGQIADIARTIVKKLPKTYPNKFSSSLETGLNSADTIFLIDETIGMSKHVAKIKSTLLSADEKVKMLPNGRTGLYSYSDYNNSLPVWHHLTLNSYSDLQLNMATLRYLGDTADNTREISLLQALKTILMEQPWQSGANKSIVVITEHGYRDPDSDGTTLEEIISLSLSIDPVNIYVIGPEENREKFKPLTEGTNGGYYNEEEAT